MYANVNIKIKPWSVFSSIPWTPYVSFEDVQNMFKFFLPSHKLTIAKIGKQICNFLMNENSCPILFKTNLECIITYIMANN